MTKHKVRELGSVSTDDPPATPVAPVEATESDFGLGLDDLGLDDLACKLEECEEIFRSEPDIETALRKITNSLNGDRLDELLKILIDGTCVTDRGWSKLLKWAESCR